jgi:DNA-binding MarR family transcriptional regulator
MELADLVWEVASYIEAMGETALSDTPLTLAASGTLCMIYDEPGITVTGISRRIPKTPQATSQVASRLRKLGLIERRLGDGPGVGLYVTEAGRQMADVAITHERALTKRLRELLGSQRYELLKGALADSRAILRQTENPTHARTSAPSQ